MCKNIALNKDFILRIRDCIKRKDWQALVDNRGLELYLLPRWENFVHSLPKNPRYMFLEYLNDASKRKTIAEIVQNCSITPELLVRLTDADELFIKKTSEINVCIWCDEDNMTDIYPNKTEYWYYYRIPPEHIEYWGSDIAWLKEIAEKRGGSLFCGK